MSVEFNKVEFKSKVAAECGSRETSYLRKDQGTGYTIGKIARTSLSEPDSLGYFTSELSKNTGIQSRDDYSCVAEGARKFLLEQQSKEVPSGTPTQVPTQVPRHVPRHVPSKVDSSTSGSTTVPSGTSVGKSAGTSADGSASPTEIPTAGPAASPTEIPTAGPTEQSPAGPAADASNVPTDVPTTVSGADAKLADTVGIFKRAYEVLGRTDVQIGLGVAAVAGIAFVVYKKYKKSEEEKNSKALEAMKPVYNPYTAQRVERRVNAHRTNYRPRH